MSNLLPTTAFQSIAIAPHQGLSLQIAQGGPLWPDWDAPSPFRTFRDGGAMDEAPEPIDLASAERLDGAYIWAGFETKHFGHFVAEQASRILPLREAHPDLKAVFLARTIRDGADPQITPFVWQVLDWFNVKKKDVLPIVRPTIAETLWARPQAETFKGYGPSRAYLDLLDTHTSRKLGVVAKSGPLYVSRHIIGPERGGHAGEAYLVECLEKLGIKTIAPEQHPLADQMRAYAASDHLIFAEGSAIHGRQLIGRQSQVLDVLSRRHRIRLTEEACITPRVAQLNFVDVSMGRVHTVRKNGRVKRNVCISIYDVDALIAFWRSRDVDLGKVWSTQAFQDAQTKDLKIWRKTCLTFADTDPVASVRQIALDLATLGLDSL